MIAIIDYGMGNIHSVRKALDYLDARTYVTNKPQQLKKCEKLVLPGVGAFGDAMLELERQGLVATLKEQLHQKKIFLGICLGMHLLFEVSDESRGVKGLGILQGRVNKFPAKEGLKVPHIGWNQLKSKNEECPLLRDVPGHSYVYFCHSYYPDPKDKNIAAASTDYGVEFPSVVWQENIYGLQFHPEKSQQIGLKILKNFVELC